MIYQFFIMTSMMNYNTSMPSSTNVHSSFGYNSSFEWQVTTNATDYKVSTDANSTFTATALYNSTYSITHNITAAVPPADMKRIYSLLFWINGVTFTCIGVFGLATNIVNIAVMSMLIRRGRRSLYIILLAMACADCVVMLIIVAMSTSFWVYDNPNLPTYDTSPYARYWFYNTWFLMIQPFETISNWLAVLMCSVRVIAVYFPLKVGNIMSRGTVNKMTVAVYILGTAMMIPNYSCVRVVGGQFQTLQDCPQRLASLIFSNPLPLILTLLLTLMLIFKLFIQRRAVENLVCKSQVSKQITKDRARDQKQLTVTLLLVAFFYILMNTPNFVYWIFDYNNLWVRYPGLTWYDQTVLYSVNHLLVYLSYSCNFLIYIVFNRSFRLEFKHVITCHTKSLRSTQMTRQTTITLSRYRRESQQRGSQPGRSSHELEHQISSSSRGYFNSVSIDPKESETAANEVNTNGRYHSHTSLSENGFTSSP